MKDDKDLTEKVIGCAIEVHRHLGPGLLESVYERCLAFELAAANIQHETQKEVMVNYKGVSLDLGYRTDLVVENRLIIELKAVDQIMPVHEAQLLTYMKLAGISLGLLINFNMKWLKDGIKRFVF